MTFAPLPPKDWAVDGSLGGTSRSRTVSSLGVGKVNRPGGGIPAHFEAVVPKQAAITAEEVRVETGFLDDAQHVVVAFGTPAKFVRYVVGQLRAEGVHVGFVRPISLWPFPYEAVAAAAEGVRSVMVFEINGGQMVDDVRIGVQGKAPVVSIGGISTDGSGFGVGPLLDVEVIRGRVEAVVSGQEVPA